MHFYHRIRNNIQATFVLYTMRVPIFILLVNHETLTDINEIIRVLYTILLMKIILVNYKNHRLHFVYKLNLSTSRKYQ